MPRRKNTVEETGVMNPEEFIKAVDYIVKEKGISPDIVFEGMELALATAYKKNFDSKTNVRVDINRATGEIKVFSYFVVVDEIDEGDIGYDEEGNEIRERGGNKDRRWINPQRESEMLLSEIDTFSPDIIVFQGKDGLWNCNINELKNKYKVIVAYHPSCWQRKADRLQYIVENIGAQL
jgi:hypothetical protein